jgi:cupin fold WbuC family metalloprotein
MTQVQWVDTVLLDRLLAEARTQARLRKNQNFHLDAKDPCQRLLNAIVPGAYVQPHRHLEHSKEEMLVILRGRLGLVFFDGAGGVMRSDVLDAGGPRIAVNIPHGVYHTAVALTPAVVFEAKAGPYLPHAAGERAAFAPAEGTPEAAAYLKRLEALFEHA